MSISTILIPVQTWMWTEQKPLQSWKFLASMEMSENPRQSPADDYSGLALKVRNKIIPALRPQNPMVVKIHLKEKYLGSILFFICLPLLKKSQLSKFCSWLTLVL